MARDPETISRADAAQLLACIADGADPGAAWLPEDCRDARLAILKLRCELDGARIGLRRIALRWIESKGDG